MAKKYHVAVVGVRAVGTEMLRTLRERRFPAASLRLLARSERDIKVDGRPFHVEKISARAFRGVDIALFAGGEKAKDHYGWKAVAQGAVVIDNSSAFRTDPRVPLVIPEVNPEALRGHQGFIANPNCSTIQMVCALKPLHDHAKIKRIVASTYQAASGWGEAAVWQLLSEMDAIQRRIGKSRPRPNTPDSLAQLSGLLRAVSRNTHAVVNPDIFAHPLAGNVLPHIDGFTEDGSTKEELKMLHETRKILGDDSIQVTTTCVRVPVFNGHSEALNVEFERSITPQKARQLLAREAARQAKVYGEERLVIDDDVEAKPPSYPLAIDASGKDPVYVGRIRRDATVRHGLNLWVVSDNLRKGAALNAVQIAEEMIRMGLL
jgi:aspartate-semialdehyde dehydrogenase